MLISMSHCNIKLALQNSDVIVNTLKFKLLFIFHSRYLRANCYLFYQYLLYRHNWLSYLNCNTFLVCNVNIVMEIKHLL